MMMSVLTGRGEEQLLNGGPDVDIDVVGVG